MLFRRPIDHHAPFARPRIRRVGSVSLLLAVGLGIAASGHAAAAAASEVREIGTLGRFPGDARPFFKEQIANSPAIFDPEKAGKPKGFVWRAPSGTLIGIPELRLLLQVWYFPEGETDKMPTGILLRDLDTLRPLRAVVLPYTVGRANGGGEWIYDVDVKGKRLFLAASEIKSDSSLPKLLLVVDLDSLRFKRLELPVIRSRDRWIPMGISYDASIDRIWSAWGNISVASTGITFLTRMDPNRPDGADSSDGIRLMRGCRGPLPTLVHLNSAVDGNYGSAIVHRGDSLYVPCHREATSGAIAIFDADTALDPTSDERLVVGPIEMASVLADPATGRMVIASGSGELWVFEPDREVFVGVLAATKPNNQQARPLSYGIDPQNGRLYFRSPEAGFAITDVRFTPVAQARVFPQFVSRGPDQTAQERIFSDVRTGRVFALDGLAGDKSEEYRIFHVPPAELPPPPPDPDLNTVDVPERQGRTERFFQATASGYGIRVLAAGGAGTVFPAPGIASFTPTAQVVSGYTNPKCAYTDRELISGRVARTELATGSAAAESIGILLDERTQADLSRPSRCDVESGWRSPAPFRGLFGTAPQLIEPVDSLGREWTQGSSVCSLPGSEPRPAGGEPHLGQATVECSTENSIASGRATGNVAGGVVDAVSEVETKVFLDPQRGVVSRTVSTVSDIDLFGAVKIARIRQIAESWARGRPGTARSKRSISIEGVVANGIPQCGRSCDPEAVVRLLNRVLVGKAQFESAPPPDPVLYKGSPRGAQSAVQKSDLRIASDRALIGDQLSEVAALQMITFNDTSDWGRARMLVQFAGVATASTYNVSLIPTGAGFDPQPGSPGAPAAPPAGPGTVAPADPGVGGLLPPSAGIDAVRRAIRRGAGLLMRAPFGAASVATAMSVFLWPLLVAGRRRHLKTVEALARASIDGGGAGA